MQGWLKLHRRILESPVWYDSTAQQKVVFIAILGMARHGAGKVFYKGKEYTLEPGQLLAGMKAIAKLSGEGVDRHTVRRALDRLIVAETITVKPCGKDGSLITVLNWEKYQGEENGKAHEKAHEKAHNKQPGRPVLSTGQTELNELLAHGKAQEKAHPYKEEKNDNTKKNDNMSKLPSLQNVSIENGADVVREVWDFYIETLKKCGVKLNRQLNDSRRGIILGAFRRGHTVGDLKKAIENTWYYGSWWTDGKYFDITYALGQRKGIDNVEARQERQGLSWENTGMMKRGRKPGSRIAPNPNRKNRFENR